MTKIVGVGVLMMAVAASTECLTRETVESIYMEADGTATWTVLERDTRSDERNDAGQLEETDYIAAAFLGQHPMARALETLRPLRIHTLRTTGPGLGASQFIDQPCSRERPVALQRRPGDVEHGARFLLGK